MDETPDPWLRLQRWYLRQCDGDWEHRYGIEIGTLDNPGWRLKLDLEGTELEGHQLTRIRTDHDENDWYHIWSDGKSFHAAGGTRNLSEMVAAFFRWAETF